MLIRITLIIAIVSGLAVGALNFVKVREKITTLIAERDDWNQKYVKADADLTKTKGELKKTSADLAETKKTLQSTTEERDKAVAEANTQVKRATALAEELGKTKGERDEAQAELAAYKATGFSPAQVMSIGKTLKQAQDSLSEAHLVIKGQKQEITKLETELLAYRDPKQHIPLPASIKGKILISDPKWGFVVLDVGQEQGVQERGELLVNRNGKLVAKVKVTSVQKDRCIANVVPGWQLGEVMEGDLVIPAYPKTS
jgi:hypothetical protein